MKNFVITSLLFVSFLTACSMDEEISIEIRNPLNEIRCHEIVEVNVKDITDRLKLSEGQEFVITDAEQMEVPYQLTYNNKVIFSVTIGAEKMLNFKVTPGIPLHPMTMACGKVYSERFDDLAWENDLVGFRAYGPALQKVGEKAFGYDLFAKRGTNKPVLENMYAMETDKIAWSEIRALKEVDPIAAEKLRRNITYHVDKGYGMDCYAVGPTLGAGVAALLNHGSIVYPWCYESCEILDNGPLRFTVRLQFSPSEIYGTQVAETRLISLDAGSHLNHTIVSYENLNRVSPIVTGIVLHDKEEHLLTNCDKGYMAYEDPTTGPENGRLFLGHVFPKTVKGMKVSYFSDAEMKERNQAKGHLLAEGEILPDSIFEYYWGFGWNRSDIKDFDMWNDYLERFSDRLRSPLHIALK